MARTRTNAITGPLVARLGAVATAEAARRKPRAGVLPPSEQMRRFLAGEERWRLKAGLITPAQYQRYTQTMIRRLEQNGKT